MVRLARMDRHRQPPLISRECGSLVASGGIRPGDEATAALAAMRFSNWLMSKQCSALLPIALLPTRIFDVMLEKIPNEVPGSR